MTTSFIGDILNFVAGEISKTAGQEEQRQKAYLGRAPDAKCRRTLANEQQCNPENPLKKKPVNGQPEKARGKFRKNKNQKQ